MNISYTWLKDYITTDLGAEDVAKALTSIGLECGSVERVDTIRGGLRGLVVGRVLTCVPHPDSDHLHITTVDLGGGHVEQIVCGAPNVAAGQTVIVATVGTTLYDGDKEFQIKKSRIRGVESMGMICAEDEIGIGTSHDGIIVIDREVAPGTPAADYYDIHEDYVIEVDLTPNRIDAASHLGVARDLAAWSAVHAPGARFTPPTADTFSIDDPHTQGVNVRVEDAAACTRYCGITIQDVKVAPSPQWLQDRLTAIGMRPINNIVDITNYILMGIGQPLHCFDRDHIGGDTVVVRTCAAGERFTTLDGVERELDGADLMICDDTRPMCMAGVFGGLDSGVTDKTTSVFLESACFNPTRVRRTARRHGLSTDSSFRFERGVDPNACLWALKVAAAMIRDIAGGRITGAIQDIYPQVKERPRVELSRRYMDDLIGKHIPDDTVDTILAALEIETVARLDDVRTLLVPTYRVDVTRPCDVVEDILRIYGYNNVEIPVRVNSTLSYKTPTDAADDMRRIIADQLTGCGFNEILNNSLTATSYYADLEPERCVRLLNPLSQDLAVMRRTMLFGGLETLAHNINRKSKDLALYETGHVYTLNPDAESTAERPLAPYSESARLSLWLCGDLTPATWVRAAVPATFYDLKAVVANVLARLGIPAAMIKMTPCTTPLLAAALQIDTRSGKNLGHMGIVARKYAAMCDVKQEVYYAELDWDALISLALRQSTKFSDLPKTMDVRRDLALLVDTPVTMAQIEQVVRDSDKRLLKDVTLFDVYEGDNLPAGKKSYAIALTLRDDERTLQDKHIDAVMSKIIANLQKRLGAQLR